jgi:hypothetical protein
VERRGVLVTTVNPSFADTASFPTTLPRSLVLKVSTVASAIVKVAERGIAPEYSVPRWIAPFQVFRVLTPPLYRWGVRTARTVKPSSPMLS